MDSVTAIQEVAIKNSIQNLDRLSTNIANANSIGYKSISNQNGLPSNDPSIIKRTANEHDITTIGNNYLSISDGSETSFTKSANIVKDSNGYLRTTTGFFVTEQGQKIQLGADAWSISENAEILVNGNVIANLDVFESANSSALNYVADGVYSGDVVLSESSPKVMIGYREMSNVNVSSELLEVMNVQNQYKSQSVLVKSYNEMMDYSINILK